MSASLVSLRHERRMVQGRIDALERAIESRGASDIDRCRLRAFLEQRRILTGMYRDEQLRIAGVR